MATTYVKGRLYKLPLADLQPDPAQVRKFMDPIALNELTASIQKHGVLTPIQFTKNEAAALMKEYAMNRYQLAESLGKPNSTVYETMTLNNIPIDVRDACRTNPNVSRAMLLDVAKQKTEASMRRRYQTLMAQADKASQPRVQKEKLTPARSLITQTDKLSGSLMNSPWQEWSEDDQNDYANALTGLRRTADELLAAMNRNPVEEEPASPVSNTLS